MHFRVLHLVIPILVAFVPTFATSAMHDVGRPAFEKKVIVEINSARKAPWKYRKHVEHYQKLLRGDVLELPGRPSFLLNEGAGILGKAIENLAKRGDTRVLVRSGPLDAIARGQLHDLLDEPEIGHTGKDGAGLKTRFKRYSNPIGPIAENISYSDITARQVVISMLVDDGVPSRLHRENILNPDFRLVGTACGINSNGMPICVVEFAVELATSKPKLL
ncbi:MAG: CAP domain-containing protein [Pyrinomonadaceae bacterium]|nr:CAP domain-containing protein [Pyrinomonadaceae bacterium]